MKSLRNCEKYQLFYQNQKRFTVGRNNIYYRDTAMTHKTGTLEIQNCNSSFEKRK